MKLSRRPRAVIFDLDGVLLDTEPLYTQALASIAAQYGKEYTWDLKVRMMGTDSRLAANLLLDELKLPLSYDEYMALRSERLLELFREAKAMTGAPEFVQALRNASIPTAVATSSFRDLCEIKWAPHSWLREFEVVLCGNDPGIQRLKPAPDIYLEAARRLTMPPEECLVFEDSPAGVRAAKAASMQVVAVKAPQMDPTLISEADWIVSSYSEITLRDLGLAGE